MRSLSLNRNCKWTEKREFRLKQRNLELILFLTRACVKGNRKLFLCKKWSDGGFYPGPCSSPQLQIWLGETPTPRHSERSLPAKGGRPNFFLRAPFCSPHPKIFPGTYAGLPDAGGVREVRTAARPIPRFPRDESLRCGRCKPLTSVRGAALSSATFALRTPLRGASSIPPWTK